MKLALAAIALCLVVVIAVAAAAGVFERSAVPMIIFAFVLVLALGGAPVVFSVLTRRARSARDTDADTHIIARASLPQPTLPSRMLPPPRTTLARPATIRGITLFTASTTTLTIRPSSSGGIVFRRTDLPGGERGPTIPALISHVVPDSRHTALRLSDDPTSPVVHTTEHILSALAALGVTDALLDLDGPEVPIGDGSSSPFVQEILAAGLTPIPTAPGAHGIDEIAPIVISKPISVSENGAVIDCISAQSRTGAPMLDLEYHLDYGENSPLPPQSASLHLSSLPCSDYIASIAPARTFCLLAEAQALRKSGLFLHMQPKDMLVIGEDGKPIENSLRFENEPARHKLLDLLGDLALTGRPIHGKIIARRSGHSLNHTLARALATIS